MNLVVKNSIPLLSGIIYGSLFFHHSHSILNMQKKLGLANNFDLNSDAYKEIYNSNDAVKIAILNSIDKTIPYFFYELLAGTAIIAFDIYKGNNILSSIGSFALSAVCGAVISKRLSSKIE